MGITEVPKMNNKQRLKLIAKAREEKRAVIFNFQTHELEYANRKWLVVDESK